MGVLLEPYIAFRCQEIEDVVVLFLRRLDIACGAVADRKCIIVCKQAVQAFQLPQKDPLCLRPELLSEPAVIHPARVLLTDIQHDLPPVKPV